MLILLGSTYFRAMRQGSAQRKGRQVSCELACEPLEPRLLLATFVWTGGSSTDWTDAANWAYQAGADDGVANIPDAGDTAIFDDSGGGGAITWSGTQDVNEIQFNNSAGNDYILDGGSELQVNVLSQSGSASNAINAQLVNSSPSTFSGTVQDGTLALHNFQNTVDSGTWTIETNGNLLVASSGTQSALGGANVDLQGGNLEFTLPPNPFTDTPGQWESSYWDYPPGNEDSGGINNGGIAPFDSFSGLNEFINRLGTPDASPLLTGAIDFPAGGGNDSTNGNPFDDVGVDIGNDNQIAVWRGFLEVDAADAGMTTFYTASDDGSVIYIDGQQVVNNNRFQGVTERSGTFDLTAGTHEIVVAFYERNGGAGVTASWDGPITGNSKILIDTTFTGNSGKSFFFTREVLSGINPAIDLDNDVTVTNNGTITIGTAVDSVELGDLTLLANQQLTVHSVEGGRGLAFANNTSLASNGTGSATFRTSNVAQLTLNNVGGSDLTDLFIQGDGTVFLPTNNTYSGTTTVEAGATLDISANEALGDANQGTVVQADGSLRLNGGIITPSDETLVLAGGGSPLSDGALHSASGNNTWSGAITLSADATIRNDANTLTLTGGIDTAGFETRFEAASTISMQTAAIMGSGSVRKTESGTLNFFVDNTYTGITIIDDGVIDIRTNEGLGIGAGITRVTNGGTLRLRNGITVAEQIEVTGNGEGNQGAIRNDAGTNTLTGTITLTGNTRFDVDGGQELIVEGSIGQNGGNRQLEKVDNGTLRLRTANTYTGRTVINDGTVVVESDQALGTDNDGTTIAAGATLEFNLPGDYTTQEALLVAGTIRNRNSSTTLASPTIDLNGSSTIESVTAGTTFTLVGDMDLDVHNLTVIGAGDTVLSGDITSVDYTNGFADGLLVGRLDGNVNTSTPNPGNEGVQQGVDYGQTNQSPPWAGQTTFVYTGQFYDADGNFAFAENIDDKVRIYIEGQEVLNNDNWNVATSTATNIGEDGNKRNSAFIGNDGEIITDFGSIDANNDGIPDFDPDGDGWYNFEIRMSNGGGGAGPSGRDTWNSSFGLGFNADPDFSTLTPAQVPEAGNYDLPENETQLRFSAEGRSGLFKEGSGSLTLSGNNSYEGLTEVRDGTVITTTDTALGSTEADTSVEAGASLLLQNDVTISENLNLAGQGDAGQPAALVSDSGSNTLSGNVTFTDDSSLGANSGATLIVDGDVDLQAFIGIVDGQGNTTINGVISSSIVNAVPLDFSDGFATAASSLNLVGDAAIVGDVLQLTDNANSQRGSAWTQEKLPIADGFSTSFTLDFANPDSPSRGADGMSFVLQPTNNTTLNVSETGPGSNALTVQFDSWDNGAADPSRSFVALRAENTELAEFDLLDELGIDLSGSGPHEVSITYDPSTQEVVVVFDGTEIIREVVDLSAIGAVDGNGEAYAGFGARTGGANEEHNILDWSFSSLVKRGTGTLTLTADNTYELPTLVQEGTLLANNSSGSATGTGTVTVKADGTLGGTGIISGAVLHETNSTLSPGSQSGGTSQPGVLSAGDGLTLSADTDFTVQLQGTDRGINYDGVNVNGEVDLTDANLNVQLDFTPALGNTFLLIDNDGTSDAVTGNFTDLPEGTIFDVDGYVFSISYAAGDGNDVALVAEGEAETEVSLDGNGNLVITDINGGITSDDLTISLQGGEYVITDPNVALTTTIAGATRPDAHTIRVDTSLVSGGLILDLQDSTDRTEIDGVVSLSGDLKLINAGEVVLLDSGDELNLGGNNIVWQSGTNSLVLVEGSVTQLGSITETAGNNTIILDGSGDLGSGNEDITVDDLRINPLSASRTANNVVYTRSGGTLTIHNDLILGGEANQKPNSLGVLTQTGGNVEIGGDLVFGGTAGKEGGVYNLNDGTLTVQGNIVETAASVDVAQMHLNGGTLDLPNATQSGAARSTIVVQRFSVGENQAATYTAAADIRTTGTLAVGGVNNGKGTFIIDDSQFTIRANNVIIGQRNNAQGLLQVKGDGLLTVTGGNGIRIGFDDMAQGTLEITENGTVQVTNGKLYVGGDEVNGDDVNTQGTVILGSSGGGDNPTLSVSGQNTEIGRGGKGSFTQYSGTFEQLSGNFVIAQHVDSEGTVTIEGGSFEVIDDFNLNSGIGRATLNGGMIDMGRQLQFGNDPLADHLLTIDGATVSVGTEIEYNNGQGILNLQSGILDLNGGLVENNGGSGHEFNFTGGTLKDVDSFSGFPLQQEGTSLLQIGADDSVGQTNANNGYDLTSGTLEIDLDGIGGAGLSGGHDQVVVTGSVDLDPTNAVLDLDLNFVPSLDNQFTIIDNDGSDAVTGHFQNLPEGTGFDLGTQVFSISYTGGDGNDVVLTAEGPAETEVSLDGNGNLVITDINGGITSDDLTISLQGGEYVITDPNVALTTTIAGATRPDAHTIRVDTSLVSSGLILDLQDGIDRTEIDGLVTLSGDLNLINAGEVLLLDSGDELNLGGNHIVWQSGTNTLVLVEGSVTQLGSITDTAGNNTIILDGSGDLGNGNENITVDDLRINPLSASRTANNVVYTRSGGTLTIHNDLILGGEENQKPNSLGVLTQTGGNVEIGGDLIFGGTAGKEGGVYNLNDGTLTVQGNIVETAANVDVAQMHLNGGTLDLPNATQSGAARSTIVVQRFSVGENQAATYTAAADIRTTGTLAVGGVNNGKGTFIIDDSQFTIRANNVIIGQRNNAQGLLQVKGDGLLTVTGNNGIRMGFDDMAQGTLEITENGTVQVTNGKLYVGGDEVNGDDVNTQGTVILGSSGGGDNPTLSVSGQNTEIGRGGKGSFTQYSGTFEQLSGNFVIAQHVDSQGTVTIEGGSFEVIDDFNLNSGTGRVTLNGGTIDIGRELQLGNNALADHIFTIDGATVSVGTEIEYNNGQGILNLQSGILDLTDGLVENNGGSGHEFNFTGGTLKDVDSFSGFPLQQEGTSLLQIGADDSVGQTSANNGYDLTSGTLEIDLDGIGGAGLSGGHDQVVVTGSVDLDPTNAVLDLDLNFVPGDGDEFVLIDNDGSDAVTGNFQGLPEGKVFDLNGNTFAITYQGGDGNDVVLTSSGQAETEVSLDGNGNLVIIDINGGDSDDNLTISSDGTSITIHDPNLALTTVASGGRTEITGATRIDGNTISVPISAITGTKIIVSTLDGEDTLTVDLANAFSRNIDYQAGSGDDGLVFQNGTFTTPAAFSLDGPESGLFNAGSESVAFSDVELGVDATSGNGMSFEELSFQLPDVTNEAELTDAGSDLTLTSANGTFQTIDFAEPSVDLEVLGGSDADEVSLQDALDLAGALDITSEDILLRSDLATGDSLDLRGQVLLTNSITVSTPSATATFHGTLDSEDAQGYDLEIDAQAVEFQGDLGLGQGGTIDGTLGNLNVMVDEALELGVNVQVNSLASFTIHDAAGSGQDFTLTNSAKVEALNGNLNIQAGDDLSIAAGTTLQALGDIQLQADQTADPGTGSTVTLAGELSATTVTVQTADDDDIVRYNDQLASTVDLLIQTYAGEDLVEVLGTPSTGTVAIQTGDDADTINIGNSGNSLDPIQAAIDVAGGNAADTVNLLGSADDGGHRYDITDSIVNRDQAATTLLTYAEIEQLNLSAGDGEDEFYLQSLLDTTAAVINAGGGDDTFTLSDGNTTLNSLLGSISLDGEDGTDTLIADDSGDTAANTGTLTAESLVGFGLTSGMDYINFEALELLLGSAGDTLSITSSHPGTTSVDVGAGDDTVAFGIDGLAPIDVALTDPQGSDTLDFSNSIALTIDMDQTSKQTVNARGDAITTVTIFENLTGSTETDTIFIDPLPDAERLVQGLDPFPNFTAPFGGGGDYLFGDTMFVDVALNEYDIVRNNGDGFIEVFNDERVRQVINFTSIERIPIQNELTLLYWPTGLNPAGFAGDFIRFVPRETELGLGFQDADDVDGRDGFGIELLGSSTSAVNQNVRLVVILQRGEARVPIFSVGGENLEEALRKLRAAVFPAGTFQINVFWGSVEGTLQLEQSEAGPISAEQADQIEAEVRQMMEEQANRALEEEALSLSEQAEMVLGGITALATTPLLQRLRQSEKRNSWEEQLDRWLADQPEE